METTFMDPKASMGLVDSTLKAFGVNYIIVGHTIVNRNIASYYGGKVIGVDVDCHNGQNYGLLFSNGRWEIADTKGYLVALEYRPENDRISEKDIE